MVDQLAPVAVGGIEHPVSRDWIIRGHLEPDGDQIYVSVLGSLNCRHSQGVFWAVANRPRATAFIGVIAVTADKPFIHQFAQLLDRIAKQIATLLLFPYDLAELLRWLVEAYSPVSAELRMKPAISGVSAIVSFSTEDTANLLICCMNGMLFTYRRQGMDQRDPERGLSFVI
ncbi:MAG: hypothetical protein AAAC47_22785 [Pararhizobium sp.]